MGAPKIAEMSAENHESFQSHDFTLPLHLHSDLLHAVSLGRAKCCDFSFSRGDVAGRARQGKDLRFRGPGRGDTHFQTPSLKKPEARNEQLSKFAGPGSSLTLSTQSTRLYRFFPLPLTIFFRCAQFIVLSTKLRRHFSS
jgi:hypothetical protein